MQRLSPRLAAAVLATIVGLAAWLMSFNSLVAFAEAARVQPAWLYPVAVDGQLLTATVAAYELRSSRKRTRFYIWTLIGLSTLVSLIANGAHAGAHAGVLELPLPAAWVASAVPALSLFAAIHVVVLVVRTAGPSRPAAKARTPARTGARTPARVRKLLENGKTTPQIAAAIGRSKGHTRKLVAAAKEV